MTPQNLNAIIASLPPVEVKHRYPLIVWAIRDLEVETASDVLFKLDRRGIPVIATWRPSNGDGGEYLQRCLTLGRLQWENDVPTVIDATRCMQPFCDGSDATAHVTGDGERYFDLSHSPKHKIGCPFALRHRHPAIRQQLGTYLRSYSDEGIGIDMLLLDWEIDGPLEWNGAWAASRSCSRCRRNIPNIDDFEEFQASVRSLRGDMQREVFTETVNQYYPEALTGNYGVHPHNGYRYWYDYFEKPVAGAAYLHEGDTRIRRWYDEFSHTGYRMGMPVVYPWQDLFEGNATASGDETTDFKWLQSMLRVGTNACKAVHDRNGDPPLVGFVHWKPIATREGRVPANPMTRRIYEELLWHLILRGMDGMALWCAVSDTADEIMPVHAVYRDSVRYVDFLEHGEPVCFDVPREASAVISAIRLGDRLLVRRTDFRENPEPVELSLSSGKLAIPPINGTCVVLDTRGRM